MAGAVRGGGADGGGAGSAAELREALGLLDETATVIGLARADLAARIQRAGAWEGSDAGVTYTEWRGRTSRQGRGASIGEERTAETLVQLPAIREAAAAGAVSIEHVRAIGDVLGEASERARERVLTASKEIVEAASTLSVPETRKQLRALVASLEADSADHGHEEVQRRRFVRLSPREGGIRIEGLLDVVAGETLRTALDAVTPVPAGDDDRSPDQRRADALAGLADHALSCGSHKGGAQVRPHLSILVPIATWLLLTERRRLMCGQREAGLAAQAGAAAVADAGGAVGDGAGRSGTAFRASGLTVEPPLAQLQDGTLIPFAALDVLACDALLQRVALDADGSPLDVGQSMRTFEGDLRRAILTRDRHCQFPGCSLRATWCEVHHIHHWANDGPTSLENGVTLCSRHHHQVHRHNISVLPVRGGFVFAAADGRRIGATSRLADALLVPRTKRIGGGAETSGGRPTGGRGTDDRRAGTNGPRAPAAPTSRTTVDRSGRPPPGGGEPASLW
ncbi:HNH endonuclease signature motif containing protein [Serinibacter arcticus]|uniref:HNH endonuclease signature motif containing protein n=1 Tax=Serinibacter arcticus TaxID=1655435 RepID=UPI001304DC2D|nr:HNH endonuclease signature motif containing protein [Serinibacter arcticus]